jgi:hypothetical protein
MGRWRMVRISVSAPGEGEKGKAFTTMAAKTKTAASHIRLDRGSGRSHAKYAAMKGRVKKPRLSA